MIVTIDGPSGTGKSTVALGVAEKLRYQHLDTGAMYRSMTWYLLDQNIDLESVDAIMLALQKIDLQIQTNGKEKRYFVNNTDVTSVIRTPEVTRRVSKVAAYIPVRKFLVQIQRNIASQRDTVCEGRDLGSVVFPNAEVKIFLIADVNVRADRRYKELMQKFPNKRIDYEGILSDMIARDKYDSSRKASPLVEPEGAHLIDTTKLTIQQVIDQILDIVKNAKCKS